MLDIVLESLRAGVIGVTLLLLLSERSSKEAVSIRDWWKLVCGFALLFFGTLIDVTDNFPVLDPLLVIGDTPLQAFLEKVVGSLLGYILLAIGIWQWLPKMAEQRSFTAQ